MRRGILLAGLGGFAGVGALVAAGAFGLWMFSHAEAKRIAEHHQYVAQAICDFRAENGLLPDNLEELVPRYLAAIPSDHRVFYSNGLLMIRTGRATEVSYSFRDPDEGWSSGGVALPVPKVTPSVVPVTGGELVRARLAAYDRRIRTAKQDYRHRTAKISYLISLGRREDAYTECQIAAGAHPDWWRAQMGMAALAPPAEGLAAEERFRAWVERHPAFVHYWYLARYYRERGRMQDALAALRRGAEHPLEDVDPDATWVPHGFAYDAATFACRQKEPELVLAITKSWGSPRGVHNYPDPNLPAFRAAANLVLGRIEEARADVRTVLATKRERAIWAGNLEQLEAAILREDRSFVYDPGPPCCGLDSWSLIPPVE